MNARRPGDILIDAFGEWVGFLKHHPDAITHLDRIHLVCVDVFSIEHDLSLDRRAGVELVHAVEGPQQRGLSTAGWTDDRRDLMAFDFHIDAGHRLETAVENVEVAGFDNVFVVGVVIGSHV